jgi:type VI secretion system protein ImpA
MSEELQNPPVVDLDALLQPISEDSPSGESLRYSGLYDEITEARRADDTLDQGAWQTELKVADYRKVINLAVPALTSQAKDLQIAAWLTESLVKEHGFPGLRDSIKLMAGLQEIFWDTLHPEIDEGDMEARANAVSWMETQTAFAMRQVPITAGQGRSFFDWDDSKRFDFSDDTESLDSEAQQRVADLRHQAETEHRCTGEMWRKAKAATRRAFCEETNFVLDECAGELRELNRVIEEKYERNQMPGLRNLQKALDDVHTQVKKLLEEKRIEEPDPTDFGELGESLNGEGAMGAAGNGAMGGSVQSRRDALRRLSEIAAFFQKTEPHSPVAYLVQRAVRWGNMPLESWLSDVIKDENVLFSLRETLGIDPGNAPETAYEEAAQEESTSEGW